MEMSDEMVKFIEENKRKIDSYNKQMERVKKYQKAHPEKMRAISNNYYARLKEADPEKFAEQKERKRQRYYTIKAQEKTEPETK